MYNKRYLKPHVTIATVGDLGSGKTTLTAAISSVLAGRNDSDEAEPYECICQPPEERFAGAKMATVRVEYESRYRCYTHIDCALHTDYVKNILSGNIKLQGAILVVSAATGIGPEAKEQIQLLCKANVRHFFVYVNGDESLLNNKEQLNRIDTEIRTFLSTCEFMSARCSTAIDPSQPVSKDYNTALEGTIFMEGSALGALNDCDSKWADDIAYLMDIIDELIPKPVEAVYENLVMPIDDYLRGTKYGNGVIGYVESGKIQVDHQVEVFEMNRCECGVITHIEVSGKSVAEGLPGERVCVFLKDIQSDFYRNGLILGTPGCFCMGMCFTAQIYVLTKEEGGRRTPFYTNYRPRFLFRNLDVTGCVTLLEDGAMAEPGDNLVVKVELLFKTFIQEGQYFTMLEGANTIGFGFIMRCDSE